MKSFHLNLQRKKVRAMFGYGEIVRVVSFGEDVSIEFCGGTSCKNTSEIGVLHVKKEQRC